jgi:L-amino acid N-acyltransferase YncA
VSISAASRHTSGVHNLAAAFQMSHANELDSGGLRELIAEVLPENAPMLKLFRRFGFRTVASKDPQVKHLALQLA